MTALSPLERRLAVHTSPAILPGLERTRSLLTLLGEPQRGLKAVHVAGSNGKGSVCRMLESVLVARGLRTGLFISPHLVRFNERFRFGGEPASDAALTAAARPLWGALKEQSGRPEGPATYFEALTALAFLFFKRQRVEVLVLETGLGGRLDSTNVVEHPLLTVITNISLEHTQILGKTEAAIAFEKAGIIKPGSPLVTAASGKARAVILKRFKQVQAGAPTPCLALREGRDWNVLSWHDVPEAQSQTVVMRHLGEKHILALPLLGAHQHENLACVLAAFKLLAPRLSLGWKAVLQGLAGADWPGRLQVFPGRPLTLVDGAHNPGGAVVLARYVQDLQAHRGFPRQAWVVGVLKDKDWRGMFRAWKPLADRFFLATPPDARGLEAGEAARWLKGKGCSIEVAGSVPKALAAARRWAGPQGLVVAAGSLYTVGALLKTRRAH
jgi:dihydrofolate synthase/folylpolyglutamate synthase